MAIVYTWSKWSRLRLPGPVGLCFVNEIMLKLLIKTKK